MDRPSDPLKTANSIVTRRPVITVLVALLVMVSLARTLERIDEGSNASGWWSVALVAWIALAIYSSLAFPRLVQQPRSEVAAILSALALTPVAGAFVAKIAKPVEMWTYYLAAPVSLALLVVSSGAAGVCQKLCVSAVI